MSFQQQSFPGAPSRGKGGPSVFVLWSSFCDPLGEGGPSMILPGEGRGVLLWSSFCDPSGGSHVTYPIMHLMLPVCCPDTNWWLWLDAAAYILLGPPSPRVEQTDKHVWKHYLSALRWGWQQPLFDLLGFVSCFVLRLWSQGTIVAGRLAQNRHLCKVPDQANVKPKQV